MKKIRCPKCYSDGIIRDPSELTNRLCDACYGKRWIAVHRKQVKPPKLPTVCKVQEPRKVQEPKSKFHELLKELEDYIYGQS